MSESIIVPWQDPLSESKPFPQVQMPIFHTFLDANNCKLAKHIPRYTYETINYAPVSFLRIVNGEKLVSSAIGTQIKSNTR